MSGFAEACEQVVEELEADLIAGSNEAAVERASDPLRLQEAEAVAPCAERFADYEVAPPSHGKGLGQAAGPALIPPLGKLVGEKNIARLDGAGRDELHRAVATSLAWGYIGLASRAEVRWHGRAIEPRLDPDPGEVWNQWLPRLATGLDDVEIPGGISDDRILRTARGRGRDQLTAKLREIDLLPGRLKRMRLRLVAEKYFDAGVLLRTIQGAGSLDPVPGFSSNLVERYWPLEGEPPQAQ